MPIGFHTTKRDTLFNSLQEDVRWGEEHDVKIGSQQIFVTGPQSYREIVIAEKQMLRNYLENTNLKLVVHGAYVDSPWNRNIKGVNNIKRELNISNEIGATGVVVHLGKGAADNDNLHWALEKIAELPEDVRLNQTLFLEINAAKPTINTFETPEKLDVLFNQIKEVDTRGLDIGLCIDTAHLSSCGVTLSSHQEAKKWLDAIPRVTTMLHLNDSHSVPASGIDVHAPLTRGVIWEDYHPETGRYKIADSGLMTFLEWAGDDHMVILERDRKDIPGDLNLIKNMGFYHL